VLKRPLALLVVGLAGVGALVGLSLTPADSPSGGGGVFPGPREIGAAEPARPGPDPFGYSAAFDAELKKIGPISPKQFAERYPAPKYLDKPSFDPTAAKFFAELNVEKVKKPGGKSLVGGKEHVWPEVELPGYKLTPDELAAFKANGFVASERLGGRSFGQLYYDVYHRDLPVFVTSDSVLHAWHRSYDAMLEELELTYLMHALDALLAGMHDALPAANEAYGAGVLKDSVRDADFFLAVARTLLNDGRNDPPPDAGPRPILAPAPVQGPAPKSGPVAPKLDQADRVNATLAAVKNEGMHEFKLFGRVRNMDFSQFKPRGHYESKPELRRYFRAMMWCGRTDLRIAGGYDKTGPLSAPRELGAALVLLDLLRRADKEETWRKFDRCIQTFVGRTDSATFDDLAAVAGAAKIKSPADLKTAADLEKLTDAVKQSGAGRQDVRGDVYISPPGGKATLPQSFTVLGQKFVIDSWVTSKTVYSDIEWDGKAVQRRVPGGLDVAFAALGNNHATPELVQRMEAGTHRWRDQKPYQHNLAAVRNVLDGLDAKAWDETIYMQWLKTLRTLSAPADDKMPEAMKTRAWGMKQVNTQMASWTQLRHDTILYVKQSYTEGATCYYPAGFVEPVVPFWAAMDAMASRSATLLEQTPFPDAVKPTQAKQVAFLRAFATQMGKLRAVAEKQLDRKELTADEKKVLRDVMQIVHHVNGCVATPQYTGWYPALFYRGPDDCMKWDALVADVHTDVPCMLCGDPGSVLHQGVGNVDLMVIAIDNGTDRVVYVGPTMSHYEFETPSAVRKTDKEWKRDLLDAKFPPRPDYTRGYLVPATDRKPADERTKNYLLSQD
jgi:hypothetical protein